MKLFKGVLLGSREWAGNNGKMATLAILDLDNKTFLSTNVSTNVLQESGVEGPDMVVVYDISVDDSDAMRPRISGFKATDLAWQFGLTK